MSYSLVTFAEDHINGIELLKRSGLDIVTVSFGGLGEGVCSIDEHGCPSSACRKRVCQGPKADDPFWQYYRQDSTGNWRALALGASATQVHDGDVDGWSWTGTTPGLPPLTLADVAIKAGFESDSLSAVVSPAPGAVFRREGTTPSTDEQRGTDYLVAGGILFVAIALSTFVVVRGRRRGEAA